MIGQELTFPKLEAVLAEYGYAVQEKYKDILQEENKIASGELFNSVEFDVTKDGRRYQVTLDLLKYWRSVEYGTKPGKWVSKQAIRDWIEVKPVIPRPAADGRIPTKEQLTFLIRRKIHDKGIQPTDVLGKTLHEMNEEYLPRIRDAFAQDCGAVARSLDIRLAFV